MTNSDELPAGSQAGDVIPLVVAAISRNGQRVQFRWANHRWPEATDAAPGSTA